MVTSAVLVPVSLAAVALVDAALAGYRAATGRNGRIRKRAFYLTALTRGLATGIAALTGLAVALALLLLVGRVRYRDLVGAGRSMLWFVGPFAVVVLAALVGYAILPRRPATFLILLGLGPFTLIRPYLTVAAALTAAVRAPGLAVAGAALLAAAAVLVVEPWVHRRWYTEPA